MTVNIYGQIDQLIQYGLQKKLIEDQDIAYTRNSILSILKLEDYTPASNSVETGKLHSPVPILEKILDWAAEEGLLEADTVTYRDLLDTKIMGCFVPRPSEITKEFNRIKEEEGPIQATNYFYKLTNDSHYIRKDRIEKNEHWLAKTEYGNLEITINLSKPEKDPKAIAAARNLKETGYPSCLLCVENVGYGGRVNHPARQNLRTIPLSLTGEQWHLQFSPYVYYHEHAIILKGVHEPMKISKDTFHRLVEFTEKLPHYFVGSNADLPIVGGSILSHDHFQGGFHDFPMAKAEIEESFSLSGFPNMTAGRLSWPMSVIRLNGLVKEEIIEAADTIYQAWKNYSDETVSIHAYSGETPHNTVTPIARRKGELYELDLVLRNNRTSEEHPMGIFHPHEEVHHIKKENIGLIEVMGLAVLPGRLQEEFRILGDLMISADGLDRIAADENMKKHLHWAGRMIEKYPEITTAFEDVDVQAILKKEVGLIFALILEHAGVFKRDREGREAFRRFYRTL